MKITTGFLSGNLTGDSDIDLDATAQNYADLLTEKLREAYPDAEIEVDWQDAEGVVPYSLQTSVDGDTEHEEVAAIDSIAERVFEAGEFWVTRSIWHADDGNCECEFPDAESAEEAAQAYLDGGDWGEVTETLFFNIHVWLEDGDGERSDEQTIALTLDPDEPACCEDDHDWQSPHEIVGGIKENPGVWGHGGGAIITECCMHCGCKKTTDTWAQNPETGEQGLTSVSYEENAFTAELEAE
jgi:hypothetical protein